MSVREQADGRRWGRRRFAVGAAAAVVALVVLVVVLVMGGPDSPADRTGESATTTSAAPQPTPETSAPPEVTPVPAAPDPAAGADELPPALPAAALDAPVDVEGVVASLVSVEPVDGQATEPGDVAGPAFRITVRIQNRTGQTVSLDGVTVNAFHGDEQTPSIPLAGPSAAPFSGTVRAGDSADGSYVFRVPASGPQVVTVEVGYRPGAPRAVFTGSTG